MKDYSIDLDVLIESACGDREIAIELLDLYFDQTGQEMALLIDAATSDDVSAVKASAHKMVGSSMACGLIDLTDELHDLEELCRQEKMPDDIDERMKRLTNQLSAAREYVEATWKVD